MHKTSGQRDPAAAFPVASGRDDAGERRDANRAIAVRAIGLAPTGIIELLIAILTNSVVGGLARRPPRRSALVAPARCG